MRAPEPVAKRVVVRKSSAGAKIGMFFLGLLFGILLLAGGIAGGGYWLYKHLNLKMLEGLGVQVGTEVIAPDSPIRTMTIEGLIAEIGVLGSDAPDSTLNALLDRYKINLSPAIKKYIPAAALEIPVKTLFSSAGFTRILEETDGQYVVDLLGTQDPLVTKLFSGKKLSVLFSGDLVQMTAGLYLGDVMGYKNTETTQTAWTDADGKPLSPAMASLAEVPLADLLSGKFELSTLTEKLTIGDVITIDENSAAILRALGKDTPINKLSEKIDTIYIGEVMGLSRKQLTDADGAPILDEQGNPVYEKNADGKDIWYETVTGEGGEQTLKEASGVGAGLADIKVSELENSEAIQENVNELKLGDVMKVDETSNAILRALKDTKVKNLSAEINNLKIATVMELTFDEAAGTWLDKNGKPANGVMAAFADLTVTQLSDSAQVNDCINNLTLGKIISINESSPAILRALATTKLNAFSDRINNMYLGEMMDLSRKPLIDADGAPILDEQGNPVYETDPETNEVVWYNPDGTPATGINAAFANVKVAGFNGDAIKSNVNRLKVGDIFEIQPNSIFSLIDGDTTIVDLPTAMVSAITQSQMGKLQDAGILSGEMAASVSSISKVAYFGNTTITDADGNPAAPQDCWWYCTMTDFFSKVAEVIAKIPIA